MAKVRPEGGDSRANSLENRVSCLKDALYRISWKKPAGERLRGECVSNRLLMSDPTTSSDAIQAISILFQK